MKLSRLVESVSGVLASVAGFATLAYLLFVPVYRGTGCVTLPDQPRVCDDTYATLLNSRHSPTVAQVAIVSALLLAVGAGAVWHAWTRRGIAQVVVASATVLLGMWAFCPVLVPGMYLLLSIALAVVACIASVIYGEAIALGDDRGGDVARAADR
jgi:hypothetical protein